MELHVPWVTYFKAFAAVLLAYAVYVLWPLLLLVFLALFLAVTLRALVDWLDAKGMRHGISLLVVVGGLLGLLITGLALIVPVLIDQAAGFSQNLPKLRADALNLLPVSGGMRQNIEHMLHSTNWAEAGSWFDHFASAGGIALGGIAQIALLIVIAMYLLIDGSKINEWLLAFFSPLKRRKLRITSEEVSKVIVGYVAGQVITSVLVMLYTFIVLSLLQVLAALPVIASYAAVERIWLKPFLRDGVSEKHELQKDEQFGEKV